MNYHIDTGLIYEKFAVDCECPLCEIKKVVEEQFLYEFLNDAVMEDNTRIKVGKQGFCSKHFDMLFSRQNKLSVALQIDTRVNKIDAWFEPAKSTSQAKKIASAIEDGQKSCVICDLIEESMVKYYKTIAQMFVNEKDFYKILISSKGFCLPHYAELLKYSTSAGFGAKEYLSIIGGVQKRNMERLQKELRKFCNKHDYRNALEPLGSAETALPRMGEKLYGKKYD
jgi:hypothetical protein